MFFLSVEDQVGFSALEFLSQRITQVNLIAKFVKVAIDPNVLDSARIDIKQLV